MIPYLKGFHLTAELWHGGQDIEGWKLPKPTMGAKVTEDDQSTNSHITARGNNNETKSSSMDSPALEHGLVEDEDVAVAKRRLTRQARKEAMYGPEAGTTQPAPRLLDDIRALMMLASSE